MDEWVKATFAGRNVELVVFASGRNSHMRIPFRLLPELKKEIEATFLVFEAVKGSQ